MSDIRRRLEELKLKRELEKNRANNGAAASAGGAGGSVPSSEGTGSSATGGGAGGNAAASRVNTSTTATGSGGAPPPHGSGKPANTESSSSAAPASSSSSAASQILSQLPPSFTSPSLSVLKYRDTRNDPLCSHMSSSSVVSLFKKLNGRDANGDDRVTDKTSAAETGDATSTGSSFASAAAVQFYASAWKTPESSEASEKGVNVSKALEEERNSMVTSGSEYSACRSVNHYIPDKRLAQGVYGVVFSATVDAAFDASSGTGAERPMFALKQVKKQWLSESQVGFPPYLLREFDLLLRMRHQNVVRAHEVVLLDRAGDLDLSRWFGVLKARRERVAAKLQAKAKEGMKAPASLSTSNRRWFSFSTRERFQIAQEYRRDPEGLMQRISKGLNQCFQGSVASETVATTTSSETPSPPSQSVELKGGVQGDSTSLSNLIHSPTFKGGEPNSSVSAPPAAVACNTASATHPAEAKSIASEPATGMAPLAPHAGGEVAKAPPVSKAKDVYLVMEYCKYDLKNYLFLSEACPQDNADAGAAGVRRTYLHLSSKNRHPEALHNYLSRIKCIAYQLFEGLAYLHEHRVIHRDLKSSNILVGSSKEDCGRIKIADFGLARCYREGQDLTQNVVTLLYRAPELHLAITDYSYGVDVWSAACIVCDLLLKVPLFHSATVANLLGNTATSKPGHRGASTASYSEEVNELEHFTAICDIIGIPTEESFSALYKLPHAAKIMRRLPRFNRENRLRRLFERFFQTSPSFTQYAASGFADSAFVADFLDLLESIFKWNPMHRPSARDVLKHRFFTSSESAPPACDRRELLNPIPFAFGPSHGGTPALRRQRTTPQSCQPDPINIASASETRHSQPHNENDASSSTHGKRGREVSSEAVEGHSLTGGNDQQSTATQESGKEHKRARSEQPQGSDGHHGASDRDVASNMDTPSARTSPMSTSNSDTSVELEALRDEQATPPAANEERRLAHSHHFSSKPGHVENRS